MNIVKAIKDVLDLSAWTDSNFVSKSMPEGYYIGANGIHNNSLTHPGFSIVEVDSSLYRGGLNATMGAYASHNFLQLFHSIPEIFAPIHAIASRVANADWQFRMFKNDEVVYEDAAWNRLYETPNPLQHFRELIYEAVVYEIVTGNQYMFFNVPETLDFDYKNVSGIWNLPADKIEQLYNKRIKLFSATKSEEIVVGYKLQDYPTFNPFNILHVKSISLNWDKDKLKGTPILQSAEKAITNLIAVYEARNVIYTKRGALGFIVSRKTDDSGLISLTPKEKLAVREEYNGNYGITNHRTPVGITEAPIDFVKIGMSISELQPFDETLADAAAIYGTLGVPFELAPKVKGETYSNQENAERSFYQNVIIPRAMSIAQSISNKLNLSLYRRYIHPSFDHIAALQEDKKEKAEVDKITTETMRVRFLNGVITLNEWVVASGYKKMSNALYDKTVFDMTPDELAKVKEVLTMKSAAAPEENPSQTSTNQPQLVAV